ncbi:hypothetical protein [Halovivax limisalsi]|uniref:hypothetical protein n=1 Tax=Halovivax limisalsi TaxID=1453760 RepID=UPI001FFC3C9F|nr:hypothetical protein [Halovivax limisalsi]
MVEERIEDGVRIAELFASEVDGRSDGPLGGLAVTDAVADVEPTVDGARAYDITRESSTAESGESAASDANGRSAHGDTIASVFVQPDRAHVAFREGPDAAREAATERDLRARPKASRPPQTLVFLDSGAAVKRGVGVLDAVARSL